MEFPPVFASRPWRRAPGAELPISIHGLASARRNMPSPALLSVIKHTAPPEKSNQRVRLCLCGCSLSPTYCWSEPAGAICRTAPIACESGLCTQWARCPPAPTTPSCLAPQPTRSHLCMGGASVVLRSKMPITTMRPSLQSMQLFAKITQPIKFDSKLDSLPVMCIPFRCARKEYSVVRVLVVPHSHRSVRRKPVAALVDF
jgi:hypothetical protein